jgi:hypothetical protein
MNGLAKPLLVGLAIRESLAPWTGHPFDFEIWVRLGAFMQSGGSPYSLLPFVPSLSFNSNPLITSISYPPLSAFVFWATYSLYTLLGSSSAYLYYFLLKQPMVLSDLLVAVMLYKLIALQGGSSTARRAALIWVFFPFGIIISAMWGPLEPPALLLVLAGFYTLKTRRPGLSATLLGFATYLKLTPVVLLPLFLLDGGLSQKTRVIFLLISTGIPLVGTVVPFYLFGWTFSGFGAALSYQAALPDFGGIGIFNGLSLIEPPHGALSQALGIVWLPALVIAYAYTHAKKMDLVQSSFVAFLAFSVFRPVMPEQWALYPIAFLLLMGGSRTRTLSLIGVASAYLLTNNALLVRFFAPSSQAALAWDQYIDTASAFSELRYALLFVFSTVFTAEALSAILGRQPFLASKLKVLARLGPRQVALSVAYVGMVALTGGLLDFTVTKMVTDWALALDSNVLFGLSWLSLYHIMLLAVFEVMVVTIVLFSRRSRSDSLGLFLLLTFLNFVASSISLVVFRFLDGTPVLTTTTIYLISSIVVPETTFVVFAVTFGALGILYLNEIRHLLLFVVGAIAQITKPPRRTDVATSVPSPP